MPTAMPLRRAMFSSDSQSGSLNVDEGTVDEYPGLDQEAKFVARSLSRRIEKPVGSTLPKLNQAAAFTDKSLGEMLDKTNLYSKADERWLHIPEDPRYNSDLHSPVMAIFSTILALTMAKSTHTDGSTCSIVETWKMPLAHQPVPGHSKVSSSQTSSPSLAIVATGPSFELPESGVIGFRNIATCIQVVTEENIKSDEEHIFELGVFAKQNFIQQPNRDAVRLMYITEERAALVHFDRAGVQSTRKFWYHIEPETLVRFIFTISSFDEEELGFDNDIVWKLEDGKKVAGHVNVIDKSSVRTSYPMRSVRPLFERSDICSKGLRIWGVTDPKTGKDLIVKDLWLPASQTPESKYLALVRGVMGIAQIVGQQAGPYSSIVEMRAVPDQERKESSGVDLLRYRIVLGAYGDRAAPCNNEKKIIEAFRDAVAALQNMNEVGLIHRNISPGSVLLGVEGAPHGWRGVVIDLDLAHVMDGSKESSQPGGTRRYMSLNVLRCRIDPAFAGEYLRDHLNDLESTFWTLCHAAYGWTIPGCHIGMRQFADFAHCDRTSFELKDAFFQAKAMFDTAKVLGSFGSPTRRLLEDFFLFLKEINQLKFSFDDISDIKKQRKARMELVEKRDAHYKRVLAIFDRALMKLGAPSRSPFAPMKINLPSFLKR